MDKYEYQVCADQIKHLIDERRFTEAMNIADTIDWRKVRSVSMLCTVSEVYKINKKYEEARDILLLAYDRHPNGRTIVYALCELAIKLNDVLQAKGLYEEFREKLFMRKIDIIYYRFTLIQDKYRPQYFKEMKESFLNQKEEYEYDLDLRQINDYYKNLFKSAIKAETPEELDFYLKITKLERRFNNLKKENRSLKKENRKLKKTNRELLSSNSWKITRPLRKLMRR